MTTLFRKARLFRQKDTCDILVRQGRIVEVSKEPSTDHVDQEINLRGALVLPGFVECHTHTVFAGNRGFEMEMKFQGRSYQEISQAGGGILSTVKATRAASLEELRRLTRKRIQNFISQGVTTLEIKSGYGLDLETEIKMLESIPKDAKIDIVKTFLGAHAKPPEFSRSEDYLKELAQVFLPEIKKRGLASRVDVFVEKGFFEKEDSRTYLKTAQQLGFEITVHADQLSLSGGSELAYDLAAKSADHCICVSDREIQGLARSGTTAVLLPAADLYLKCPYPPARKMLDAGVTVALATDFNPGTSPTQDLNLVGVLARREMRMTLDEVVFAYTEGAAKALGLEREVGRLEAAKRADFTVWDCDENELFLSIGGPKPVEVYKNGQPLFGSFVANG
ncbi:MAG: imidazolonepropionase [Bdellovibrionales bacterium]